VANDFRLIPPGDETPEPSNRANDESLAIANRRLAKIQRGETKEKLLHQAACSIFVTAVAAVIVGILTLAYHYMVSPNYHFMTTQQLADVKTILLAAMGTKAVSAAGERWLKDSLPED
jgi:hypothetical protein